MVRGPWSVVEEIRQIYGGKSFAGEDLERIVQVVTADEARWVISPTAGEHRSSVDAAADRDEDLRDRAERFPEKMSRVRLRCSVAVKV